MSGVWHGYINDATRNSAAFAWGSFVVLGTLILSAAALGFAFLATGKTGPGSKKKGNKAGIAARAELGDIEMQDVKLQDSGDDEEQDEWAHVTSDDPNAKPRPKKKNPEPTEPATHREDDEWAAAMAGADETPTKPDTDDHDAGGADKAGADGGKADGGEDEWAAAQNAGW